MIVRPRGTQDVYNEKMEKFEFIENIVKKEMFSKNASRVQFPVFEATELFVRGVGNDTDIVQKEMYTFLDKSSRSLTLRPEGTASSVRAYIENGWDSLPKPKKIWYMIPVYRYENVQKGRQREFNQIGVEYFGSENPVADFEVIVSAINILEKIGIKEYILKLNSIGCTECRNKYKEKLLKYLKPLKNEYCEDCKRRMTTNVLRVLDCKEEKCKKNNLNAPSILESLCTECKEHFESLKKLLDVNNIKYVIDDKIVRGLDYYNRTVFEVQDENGIAILGGGRYDGLGNIIGEKYIPAVGFAIGVERLVGLIDKENICYKEKNTKIYVITENSFIGTIFSDKFRKKGKYVIENDLLNRNIRGQIKAADKLKFDYAIFLDDIDFSKFKKDNCISGNIKELASGNVLNFSGLISDVINDIERFILERE